MQVMPANAQPKNAFDWDTTQDLYFACKSNNTTIAMACMKYLQGVLSMMQLIGLGMDSRPERTAFSSTFEACAEDVTAPAMIRIFINWAEKHPKQWGKPPAFGAWAAYAEAFPCPPRAAVR
jgi:Rap1a immunity proteins